MSKKLLTLFLSTISLLCLGQKKSIVNVDVMPPPQRAVYSSNKYLDVVEVSFVNQQPKGGAKKLTDFQSIFKRELEEAAKVKVIPKGGVQIIFSGDLTDMLIPFKDAFELEIKKNKVIIKADSYNGYIYATRLLLQFLINNEGILPIGTIADFSLYETRALSLDVAQAFIPLDEIKDYIRQMAWVRMNELYLKVSSANMYDDQGDFYRLPSNAYPKLSSEKYYSWKEISELEAFADLYGIEIIPELELISAARPFTKVRPELSTKYNLKGMYSNNYLDASNKESINFLKEVLAEVCSGFKSKRIHIGVNEYKLSGVSNRTETGEIYRNFISDIVSYARTKSKNAIMFSTFYQIPQTPQTKVKLPKNTVIDLLDSRHLSFVNQAGFSYINSTDAFNFVVPNANPKSKYAANNAYTYEKWSPRELSAIGDIKVIPDLDKTLLGAKLNILNETAPAGLTSNEIARYVVPTINVFGDRMWGTKKMSFEYPDFEFKTRYLLTAPLTKFFERKINKNSLVYSLDNTVDLSNIKAPIYMNLAAKNLEYPFTVEMTLTRTKEPKQDKNETILSSDISTFYASVAKSNQKANLVRAGRNFGNRPLDSSAPLSIAFDSKFPIGKPVILKIITDKNSTKVFIDSKQVYESDIQWILPIDRIGSKFEDNFGGTLSNLKIWNYVRN